MLWEKGFRFQGHPVAVCVPLEPVTSSKASVRPSEGDCSSPKAFCSGPAVTLVLTKDKRQSLTQEYFPSTSFPLSPQPTTGLQIPYAD